MNALSINIPANFIASCESTLKRYNAAKTDAERRAVLDRQTVLLYEPEEAAKIFAQLCGYTLLDKNGRVVTGRMPGQEEQK